MKKERKPPKNRWLSVINTDSKREEVCRLIVANCDSSAAIKQIYKEHPETQTHTGEKKADRQKDWLDIYNAIRPMNPYHRRFNLEKYGHIILEMTRISQKADYLTALHMAKIRKKITNKFEKQIDKLDNLEDSKNILRVIKSYDVFIDALGKLNAQAISGDIIIAKRLAELDAANASAGNNPTGTTQPDANREDLSEETKEDLADLLGNTEKYED